MKLNGVLVTLCAVIFLASCSENSDSPESPGTSAIEFSRIHINHLTQSRNSAQNIPFNQFKVYSFTDSPEHYIFDGALVTDMSDGKWECDKREYWYPDHDYWFSAIAPADANGVIFNKLTATQSVYHGGGTITYRPSENGGTLDLLYAFSGRIATPHIIPAKMPPVELEFNHLLSQVTFMFYNDLGNPHFFINVPSITLGNLYSEGVIDLTQPNPQWERSGWDSFWTGAGRVDQIKVNQPKSSSSVYLLPIKMEGAVIQLQTQLFYIENPDDEVGFQFSDVNTFTIDFPDIDFQPGHSYTLIAHLNHDNVEGDTGVVPISFEVQDNSWRYGGIITVP